MSVNGDASEQVVRLSLEGFEVIAKLTGSGAKNIAAMLYTIMKDKNKNQTRGKMRLTRMLQAGKPLKIFTVSKEDLKTFRKVDSYLQGHPDMKKIPGVDMTSGSLGQGLSVANGMALSAKLDGKNYRVYCIMGDGEIEEGQIWEAAMTSSHYKLDNLCAIVDNNDLQIDGKVGEVMNPYPIDKKFESFGFNTIVIDGHNFDEILKAFEQAKETKGKPSVIIAKTLKGKGVSYMENKAGWHGKAPNEEEYKIALEELV